MAKYEKRNKKLAALRQFCFFPHRQNIPPKIFYVPAHVNGLSPSDLPLDILSPVTRKSSPHMPLLAYALSFHNPHKIPIPLDFSRWDAYNGSIETDEEE